MRGTLTPVKYIAIDDDITPRGRYRREDDPERNYGLFVYVGDTGGFITEEEWEAGMDRIELSAELNDYNPEDFDV